MIGRVAKTSVQSGGSFSMPLTWTVMASLGVLMVALFGYIRFALYPRFGAAVAAADWAQAADRLAQPAAVGVGQSGARAVHHRGPLSGALRCCTGADFLPRADARRVDTAALLEAPAARSFNH